MFFGHLMSEYEHQEITDYQTIYFLGCSKEQKLDPIDFDDERGDYRIVKGDHISF